MQRKPRWPIEVSAAARARGTVRTAPERPVVLDAPPGSGRARGSVRWLSPSPVAWRASRSSGRFAPTSGHGYHATCWQPWRVESSARPMARFQKRPRSTSTAARPAQRRVAEARYRTTRPVADSAHVGTLAAGARHPPLEKRMVDEFPPGTARNRVQEPQEGGHPRPLASVREPNRPGWDRAGRHERRLEAGYSWLLNRLPPVLFRDRRPGLAGNALPPPMINVASDVRSPRSDWPEHRGPAVRRAAIGRRAGRAPG